MKHIRSWFIMMLGALMLSGVVNAFATLSVKTPCSRVLANVTSGNRYYLIYNAANKTWTSPNGLIYGQGSAQGNRVVHIMEHTIANPAKPVHSVFSVPCNQVIGLIDEAWAARSGPGIKQFNGNRVWIVDMGRQVGTGGQTAVQIIVRDGTTEIITAFPK